VCKDASERQLPTWRRTVSRSTQRRNTRLGMRKTT
jgi:hypothetical protein